MPTQQERFRHLWAKTSVKLTADETTSGWHPLVLHLIDVAIVAEAVLRREPERSRDMLADVLGMRWEEAEPWLLLVAACHDLGKAFPGFQGCCEARLSDLKSDGLDTPKFREGFTPHGAISCGELASLLVREEFGGWEKKFAKRVAEAAGCHHGARFSSTLLADVQHPLIAGNATWNEARRKVFSCLHRLFGLEEKRTPIKKRLSGAEFMRLAGWISFSDWIASDESRFPYGTVDDLDNLEAWRERRREITERALDEIGWHTRIPPVSTGTAFEKLFPGASPRPLQKIAAEQATALSVPSVILMEAPMGEGKTEAAWHAHLLLRENEKLGHRGLYLALPTRATGNAMFTRVLDFLKSPAMRDNIRRNVDFQLLHGSSSLNSEYKNLRPGGIHENENAGTNADADGGVRAGEWFTRKKRALLSEYGVGTVDQALLSILPVRHNFIRMWGLANRVVVLDEVHAYDTYTTKLIITLVEWLVELGSSVILLSATVPPAFRRKIAECLGADLPQTEETYPRMTVFTKNSPARQFHFDACEDGRRIVRVERLESDVSALYVRLTDFPKGAALALVNTVDRAQSLYQLFPDGERIYEGTSVVGKRLADGSEIFLFHSRFPADERQRREERILKEFGKNAGRNDRKILIATQVVEQSLDLDFDFMISDLAPTDLLLQRAGRLWRHKRGDRNAAEPILAVSGLAGDEPPDFGKPLWWGAVYREDLLLLSWLQWRGLESEFVKLPDKIDALVTAVYEEKIPVPPTLEGRYEKAKDEAEGKILAHGSLAAMTGIGHPDEFFFLTKSGIAYDDDDVLLGGTKKSAATRLGDTSVTAVIIPHGERFDPNIPVDASAAEMLFYRALPVTRKSIIVKLREKGIPKGWQCSSLLRNAYPFILDADGCWTESPPVRLDPELGLCYG